MFSSITWSDFITYAGGLAALYYTLSAPWLYRHELKRKIKNKNTPALKQTAASQEHLMGQVQPPHANLQEESREEKSPVFTATVTPLPDQTISSSGDARLIHLISALMLEANTLAGVIAGSDGTEQDTNSMFHSMLEHYSELTQSPYFSSINVFLLNACKKEGLPVTATQVESWWPQSTPSE